MMASVEAIFLSTFILITQNRMASVAEKGRARPANQPSGRTRGVTRLVTLVCAMAERMQIRTEVDSELQELKQDAALEVVSEEI